MYSTGVCAHTTARERRKSLSVDFHRPKWHFFSPADPGEEKEGDTAQKNVDESDPYQSMMAKEEQNKNQPLAVTNRSDAMVVSGAICMYPPLLPPSHLKRPSVFLFNFPFRNVECHAAHFSWNSHRLSGTRIFYRCLVEILLASSEQPAAPFHCFRLSRRPSIGVDTKKKKWRITTRKREKKKQLSGKHPVVLLQAQH